MTRCRAPLLCILLATLCDTAAASDPPWMAKLEAWLAAVEAHRPGVRDAAVETIGAWKNADLDAITPHIAILIELLPAPGKVHVATRMLKDADIVALRTIARREAARGDVNRIMKRGAVLHADIMMSGAAAFQRITADEATREAGGRGRVMALGIDGHHEGYAVAPRHFPISRVLLDAVHPDPAGDDFVRLYYRATTAYMFHRSLWGEAERQLQHERQRLTPDARAHLDSGCVHEAFAHPRIQTIVTGSPADKRMQYDVLSVKSNLELAERYFRQATVLEPALVEARVRLGRVRTLLGKAELAVPDLRAASTAATDPSVRYFAALFLGDAEQTLGRHDAARAAYGQASALYPSSQAPHLALSLLAREGGERDAARSALRKFLDVPAQQPSRADPWWLYFMGSGRSMEALAVRMWKALGPAEAR